MKVAIMQPYLFPYIGYFQLLKACDKFVIHDDVQYIRQGWINRNRIIVHGREYLFVFSVKRDDYFKNINERYYTDAFDTEACKLLRNIDQAYSKAPFFTDVRSFLAEVFGSTGRNVSSFNIWSITRICEYLGIDTEISVSSEMDFDKSLKAEDRVLAINKALGSTHYINPIGGIELYSKARFLESEIHLSFLRPKLTPYPQLATGFQPGMSIIDVMMNCSRATIVDMLADYDLV